MIRRTPLKRSTKPIPRGKRPRAKLDERWELTRELCCLRAWAQCERCSRPAPLHRTEDFEAGQGAHIERRWKSKEGKYDPDNVRWLCATCHFAEHEKERTGLCPRKPVGEGGGREG